jgi:hypothetical protein
MTMAKVIVRDPFISDCDRWETNERAKASRNLESSELCRVSAQSMRSRRTITGLVPRTLQRTPGNRTSITETRTTTIRITTNGLGPLGGGIKL